MSDIRREHSDLTLIRNAIAGLVLIALASALVLMKQQGVFSDDTSVNVEAGMVIDGVPSGSEVKFRGILVGTVDTVDVRPDGAARLSVKLARDQIAAIDSLVVARIVPSNIFALPSVELVESTEGGVRLRAGGTVPADASKGAVEAQTAIIKTYDFLNAVEPSKLAVALDSLSTVLDGKGNELGDLAQGTSSYVRQLRQKEPEISAALTAAVGAIDAAAETTPGALDAVDAALTPIRTVARRQSDIQAVLDSGTRATGVAQAFLEENSSRLITTVRSVRPVTEVLAADEDDIVGSFRQLGELAKFQDSVPRTADGLSVAVDFKLQAGHFSDYGSDDCPVYPSAGGVPALRGSQCGGTRATSPQEAGGAVGSVGSDSEKSLIDQFVEQLSKLDGTQWSANGAGDAAQLMGGPVLRGTRITTP